MYDRMASYFQVKADNPLRTYLFYCRMKCRLIVSSLYHPAVWEDDSHGASLPAFPTDELFLGHPGFPAFNVPAFGSPYYSCYVCQQGLRNRIVQVAEYIVGFLEVAELHS